MCVFVCACFVKVHILAIPCVSMYIYVYTHLPPSVSLSLSLSLPLSLWRSLLAGACRPGTARCIHRSKLRAVA